MKSRGNCEVYIHALIPRQMGEVVSPGTVFSLPSYAQNNKLIWPKTRFSGEGKIACHCPKSRLECLICLLSFHSFDFTNFYLLTSGRNMCTIYNFSSKIQTVPLSLLTNILKDNNQHLFLFMCLQYTVMAKQAQYRPGQGSRRFRLEMSRQSAHEGSKVVSPTHRPLYPTRNIPGTQLC